MTITADNVADKNPQYTKFHDVWRMVHDASEGQHVIKQAGQTYLPALPSQLRQSGSQFGRTYYDLFKDKALWYPATGRTKKVYLGMLNRKMPSLTLPPAMAEVEDDFSYEGQPIETFARQVQESLMMYDRVGVLVDIPEEGSRPYTVYFPPDQIIDWKQSFVAGQRRTTMVKLQPDDSHIDVLLLEFDEEIQGFVYIVQKWEYITKSARSTKGDWVLTDTLMPLRNGAPLDYIPFVVGNSQGLTWDIGYPLLYEITTVNIADYQNDAEYRNALAFAGRPTPCVAGLRTPSDEITLGTHTVLEFNEGGSWGMLGLDDASGISAIREAGEDLKKQMALIGARALASDPNGVESAETAKIHRAGEHGVLTNIADVCSDVMTRTLEYMADWWGVDAPVEYVVHTDFIPASIDPNLINSLFNLYIQGAITYNTLFYNLQKAELVPDGTKAETEGSGLVALPGLADGFDAQVADTPLDIEDMR